MTCQDSTVVPKLAWNLFIRFLSPSNRISKCDYASKNESYKSEDALVQSVLRILSSELLKKVRSLQCTLHKRKKLCTKRTPGSLFCVFTMPRVGNTYRWALEKKCWLSTTAEVKSNKN